ncbi:hypothetical protein LPL03_17340 [Lactiplantibacillus argentoratensis]|nr:hypothetical protein SF2A35B_2307 [Lactiplantibacillus plantarum]GEK63236.1 hypothetical protein LJA01_11390 [Lactobacillus japonicus]GEO53638.1 hypothetical protein LPL03_17340 [Lactiplantibacillus argentoratensis]
MRFELGAQYLWLVLILTWWLLEIVMLDLLIVVAGWDSLTTSAQRDFRLMW